MQSRKDKNWYMGCINNLQKRFKQYNNREVFCTKSREPFELIYYEVCINKRDAFEREKYLKSGPGKRFIKNRLKHFLKET